MDRNREARRAAAMANGLQRRRHRTTPSPGSLRDSPDDDGALELQDTARLRDRTPKKDRDRERMSRSKRRRGDKYVHREDGMLGSGVDDTSEESVNNEDDEDDDDDDGMLRYVPPSNPLPMPTSSALTSHRKSFPPPSKLNRVAPTWKAPDEMIGFSVPRKARSASTKRSHDCWSSGVVGGEQIHRQASPSPVRSMTTPAAAVPSPLPSPARPMSPSSSNVSIKRKIKTNGSKHRPPKSSSSKSSPSVQDEIEIEVAEVLYGLMRQSHAPSSSKQETVPVSKDLAPNPDGRSIGDSKSRISSPIPNSTPAPLTTVAPKRKRPRPYPDDIPAGLGPRSSPVYKVEPDHQPKQNAPSISTDKLEGSVAENGRGLDLRDGITGCSEPTPATADNDKLVEKSSGGRIGMVVGRTSPKVEEASSSFPSPMMDSAPHQLRNHHHHRAVESSKPNSSDLPKDIGREEKFGIDLMAPPSPEKEAEMEYKGGDEKCMVRDREAEVKAKTNEEGDEKKAVKCVVELKRGAEAANESCKAGAVKSEPHKTAVSFSSPQHQQLINLNGKIDLHLDLEKPTSSVDDSKLNLQHQKQLPQPQPIKSGRDDSHSDKPGGQSSPVPLPMSVPAGWHGGLAPMGYVGPLQGVVPMDSTPMASPPIQPTPHFLFSQPCPKRCATHCYIARSIQSHQQMMVKMNSYWPAVAAAGTASLFGSKPYNLNMVPPADLHASGRAGVASSALDNKGQPFAFFPGQPPSSSKDSKSFQAANLPDSSQKKQFMLQPGLAPGAASNIMHAPTLFFPMSQQQQTAASVRTNTGKSQSSGSAASTSMPSSAPMGAAMSSAQPGPAMSFSYPGMGGNETQFMAILGNGPYPFPIPAHVGTAPPYRGSHPQAMSFFNGSFYSSQMLHPSQVQPQQQGPPSESLQMQQQNPSSASSSSQKHLLDQHQRPQGSGANASGNPNQNPSLQNFQVTKARDSGGDDGPSTPDSRNRHNLNMYGQNFAMPFHSPNFAMTPSSFGGASGNAPNGNHGDKKQQQQQLFQPALSAPPFPMSFTTINGATTPLDISTMTQNHAILQSLPESARQSYQMMAAAAAAQAAQQKKNSYRGPEDGKSGGAAIDDSHLDEERKVAGARASPASVGQSIAFSRDLAENAVVDSSARSLNVRPGSGRSARPSSGPKAVTNSSATISQQQQSQMQAHMQQQQMLFAKQQQHASSMAANARSKNSSTSNGSFYPDQLASSCSMSSKFPNTLSGFPSLMQTSGAPTQPQWKNSVRPNTSQMSSPSMGPTSCASNMKNVSQQQGKPQQNHAQISFGANVANSKPSSAPQGQQSQTGSQAPSSPMMVKSPSNSSVSKSAGGSPRTAVSASTGNKSQASTQSSHQGRNSPSRSLSSQKPSILGSPHIMPTSGSTGKPQSQQSQQQPQLSKQSIQQAQLYFSNAFMQASVNTSAAMGGTGYYLQRQRTDSQHQQQGPKLQGLGPPMSGGMLSLCTPVSLANASTADPAKSAAAAALASNVNGGLPSQGIFSAAQSAGGAHQFMNPNFSHSHAMSSTTVQVKPAEQKQPAGE